MGGSIGSRLVGVGWYSAADWNEMRELVDDPGVFPEDYDVWHELATERLRRLERLGCRAVTVEIEPGEFRRWCQVHGLQPDARARSGYVVEGAARAEFTEDLRSPSD